MMIPWMIAGAFGLIAGIFLMQAQSKQKQLDKLSKNLKSSRSLAENLQQKTQGNRSDLEATRKENRELKAKHKSHRKKMHELRQEVEELQRQLEDLKSDTSGQAELLELREQLEEFQVKRSELERDRSRLETEYERRLRDMQSDVIADKERLEAENKQLKRDLNSANRRVTKMEHDLNREKKRIGGEKSQMKRLETQAINNDRAFRVTQNELHRAHRQLRELVEENAQLKSKTNSSDSSSAVKEAQSTLKNGLGLSDSEMYESSPEEFIESLDAKTPPTDNKADTSSAEESPESV